MFTRKSRKTANRIDTLIGAGTRIEGDVVFSGGLRIDGEIRGNVRGSGAEPSMLVLSEQGRIEGSVQVSHAVISGTVLGPITVESSLELHAPARITGNVSYDKLEIHHGAVVLGHLEHAASATRTVELKLAKSN
ncbi:MAG: polymer-forming cytoskeletal protein [Rhodocyclaceae bacterium]|nr:polymer-forming cytoskeletal protein [Rhodocyclaceae bacterium]MBX3666769.1 polymer-forming cytoskeletal protein [Rhodocyclaceae bacterium]